MSAYICDNEHICYLVAAAQSRTINGSGSTFRWFHSNQWHSLPLSGDIDRTVEVANMLLMENIKSVSARYPEEKTSASLPGPVDCEIVTPRDFRHPWMKIDPVQVLKACDCYVYQSCEHDDWEESEAYAFIQSLRSDAWHALPGYDAAAWGAPPKNGARKIAA